MHIAKKTLISRSFAKTGHLILPILAQMTEAASNIMTTCKETNKGIINF